MRRLIKRHCPTFTWLWECLLRELSYKSPFPRLCIPNDTFYISDNMGGFDGYLVHHKPGAALPKGWYRVRDLGSISLRWGYFPYPPRSIHHAT